MHKNYHNNDRSIKIGVQYGFVWYICTVNEMNFRVIFLRKSHENLFTQFNNV